MAAWRWWATHLVLVVQLQLGPLEGHLVPQELQEHRDPLRPGGVGTDGHREHRDSRRWLWQNGVSLSGAKSRNGCQKAGCAPAKDQRGEGSTPKAMAAVCGEHEAKVCQAEAGVRDGYPTTGGRSGGCPRGWPDGCSPSQGYSSWTTATGDETTTTRGGRSMGLALEQCRGSTFGCHLSRRSHCCCCGERYGHRADDMGRQRMDRPATDGGCHPGTGYGCSPSGATTSILHCSLTWCGKCEDSSTSSYPGHNEAPGCDDWGRSQRCRSTSWSTRSKPSKGPCTRGSPETEYQRCSQASANQICAWNGYAGQTGSEESGGLWCGHETLPYTGGTSSQRCAARSYGRGIWWPSHPSTRAYPNTRGRRGFCGQSLPRVTFAEPSRQEAHRIGWRVRDTGRLGEPGDCCSDCGSHCQPAKFSRGQCLVSEPPPYSWCCDLRSHWGSLFHRAESPLGIAPARLGPFEGSSMSYTPGAPWVRDPPGVMWTFHLHSSCPPRYERCCRVPASALSAPSSSLSLSSVALGLHWSCVCLWVDPCREQSASCTCQAISYPPRCLQILHCWSIDAHDIRMSPNCALFGCRALQDCVESLSPLRPCADRLLQHEGQFCATRLQVPRCQKDASVAQGHLPGDLAAHPSATRAYRDTSCPCFELLLTCGAWIFSLARGLWLITFLAMLRLLTTFMPRLIPRPLRRLLKANSHPKILCPLEVLTGKGTALCWKPYRDRKGRTGRKASREPKFLLGPLGHLFGCLVPLSIPVRVNPSLPCLPAILIHFLPGAYAMTRPERFDDPTGVIAGQGRPHLIPPEQLTTFVGECGGTSSWEPSHRDATTPGRFCNLSGSRPQEEEFNDGSWLGVYLYTPHYQTLTFAVRPPERTLRAVIDMIRQEEPAARAV